MRIGFNGRYIQKTLSGIEYYLLNLVQSLARIDKANEYFLFLNRQPFVDIEAGNYLTDSSIQLRISRWPSKTRLARLSWDYAALNSDLLKEKIDIFHGPSFSIPLIKTCPSVVTVHDLAFIHQPDSYTRLNRYYFKFLLPQVVSRADLIITDSYSSKEDIINYLAVAEDKIKVIYPGINPNFKLVDDKLCLQRVRLRYKIYKSFILNVSGLITPRKNLNTLIRAFSRLRRTGKTDLQLVIVGEKGWFFADIFRLISRLKLENDVIFTGPIPLDDLVALYNAAELFVFPSQYEGFGFPVLEAMSCGAPVICSNVSSLPELAGDAGKLVDPANHEELATSIEIVLGDKSLRDKMAASGLSRTRLFSWGRTAKQTLKAYKQVIGDG